MRSAVRALALTLGLLTVISLLAVPALAAGASDHLLAQEDSEPDDGEEATDDDGEPDEADEAGGEAVRGTIRDGEGDPLENVEVTVSTVEGEIVDVAVSDAEGEWRVDLPERGEYVALLEVETLPEGVELSDPERNPLEFEIRTGQQRSLIFATGEGAVGRGFTDRFLSQTLTGLRTGLIIAITAIGLSLIFGTTGLVNFAHGELVTFGAVVAWFINAPAGTGLGQHLIVAGLAATLLTAGLGGGIEKGLWQPLRRRRVGLIQMLVISIGLMLILRNVLQLWFGSTSRPYFDYTIQQAWTLGPFRLTPRDVTVMALSVLVLVGVATMLQRTRIGKAMRAVRDNRDLAESSGIDVQRVLLVVWILGGGLAGLGGVLAATTENVSFLLGFRLLLLMFAGVILGGLGTAYGAMLGSIIVGLVTEISTLWFASELKYVWGLVVLIIILLVRPQGVLGQRERIG